MYLLTTHCAVLYRSRLLDVQQCEANQATARSLLCSRSLMDVIRLSMMPASRQTPAKYGVGTSVNSAYVDVTLNWCRCCFSRRRLTYDSAAFIGVYHSHSCIIHVIASAFIACPRTMLTSVKTRGHSHCAIHNIVKLHRPCRYALPLILKPFKQHE